MKVCIMFSYAHVYMYTCGRMCALSAYLCVFVCKYVFCVHASRLYLEQLRQGASECRVDLSLGREVLCHSFVQALEYVAVVDVAARVEAESCCF